jgi:hypothetical protein
MTRRRIILFVLLALFASSPACKKGSQRPEPPPSAQPAPTNAPVNVVRVDLGNALNADKTVVVASETFKPSDTIYATIQTNGSAPTATLAIRWTYENGQVVNESSQTIAPNGPASTEFHISKPDGWPAGKYNAAVSLNGVTVSNKSFQVAG